MKISLLLFLLVSCNSTPQKSDITDTKPIKIDDAQNCICMEMYAPVCYKGKNYSNSCFAGCEGAKEGDYTQGECP